jgi:hydrogenase/urease accessory protein HupE
MNAPTGISIVNVHVLRQEVHGFIATAEIAELENQSYRLGYIIDTGLLNRADAAAILQAAAIANDLVRVHGQDFVQSIIAAGLDLK